MRTTLVSSGALFAAFVLIAPLPAAAQAFGDTNLSYQNGVVYDDDLVPGRGSNQSFLSGEQGGSFGRSGSVSNSGRVIPQASPNLIGSDGRANAEVLRSQRRAERFNDNFFVRN